MKRWGFLLSQVALLMSLASLGCESDLITPPGRQGIWGGTGIRLEMEGRDGSLLYDCGEGEISEALLTDKRGHFTVHGWFSSTPGPEPIGGFPRFPALYQGKIAGAAMTLTVTRLDTGTPIGSFNLELGNPGDIVLCR